jgi:hypothetical protein
MSVASIASLRHRLSEGRKILDRRLGGSGQNHNGSTEHLHVPNFESSSYLPEPLASKVGDTQLHVQIEANGSKVLSGLFPDTAILTMHNSELEVLPQVCITLLTSY